MNNPLRILRKPDSHLSTPSEITIFGRARVPDLRQIRELFKNAQPKVLALAAT